MKITLVVIYWQGIWQTEYKHMEGGPKGGHLL